MNERIRELAEQATTVEHGVIQPRTVATVYHFDKEKFAELIVRECADLVADDDNAFDILKHFGVEE